MMNIADLKLIHIVCTFAHVQNKIHFVETSIWHTEYCAKRILRIDVIIQKLLQFKILFSTSAFRACAVGQFFILQFEVFEIPYQMQKELCKSDKQFISREVDSNH